MRERQLRNDYSDALTSAAFASPRLGDSGNSWIKSGAITRMRWRALLRAAMPHVVRRMGIVDVLAFGRQGADGSGSRFAIG